MQKYFFKICLLGFVVGTAASAFAQRQNVYYYKSNGTHALTADSADYVQMITETDSTSKIYDIKEYYRNGKLKLIGKTSVTAGVWLEGQCISFYPDGKRQHMGVYKNNQPVGDVYNYYPNGKIYTIEKIENNRIVIEAGNDTTGVPVITNGDGYLKNYNGFYNVSSEGYLRSGIKDGEWKGGFFWQGDAIAYTETYKKGMLVSGQAVRNGIVYPYTVHSKHAGYKTGDAALHKFLDRNLAYPLEALKDGTQGVASVSLKINADGSISDIEAITLTNIDLTGAIIHTLPLSAGDWEPQRYYGMPIATKYIVSVNFGIITKKF